MIKSQHILWIYFECMNSRKRNLTYKLVVAGVIANTQPVGQFGASSIFGEFGICTNEQLLIQVNPKREETFTNFGDKLSMRLQPHILQVTNDVEREVSGTVSEPMLRFVAVRTLNKKTEIS